MTRRLLAPDLVVIVAGVVAALHVGKLPPALPVLRDALGITLLEAGFLLSLVQVAGMVAGVFVGVAADGIGLRRSVLAGLAILTVASALGGFARSAHELMWLRAVEGMGFLLAVLPAPSLLRLLVPPQRLSLRLGLWGAFMPLGTALALVCGPWVMAWVGWPGWWWALAGLTAAMTFWIAVGVPPDHTRPHGPGAARDGDDMHGWSARLRQTLSTAGPWLVAATFAMYSTQWLSVIGFLPTIYAQAGMSVAVAGAMTALVAAVNAFGNVGAGRLLHAGMAPERVLTFGFATMLVGAVVAFGLPSSTPLLVRFGAVVLLSAAGGLIPGALFSIAVDLAPGPRTVSTTIGWMQQASALGQFAGPPIVAWVAGVAGGWQWTWTVTGTASLIGMGLAALIGRVHRR